MDLGLAGKVAVITGASDGIGKETAQLLAAEGCDVALLARTADKLEQTAAEVRGAFGRRVTTVAGDAASQEDVERLVAAGRELGPIDVAIANAGMGVRGFLEDIDDDQWVTHWRLNILGVVRLARATLLEMKQRGRGRFVVVEAVSAKQPTFGQMLSNTHKAGLLALVKSLAEEFAPYGVTVNGVCPGRIHSGQVERRIQADAAAEGVTPEEIIRRVAATIPMGKLGNPRDCAAMIAFLCSDQAGYITGQSISVDGGLGRSLI
jgi:3-oxoacyl-[acyl-carrier protein] reductase